jgi:hypothetical protein
MSGRELGRVKVLDLGSQIWDGHSQFFAQL